MRFRDRFGDLRLVITVHASDAFQERVRVPIPSDLEERIRDGILLSHRMREEGVRESWVWCPALPDHAFVVRQRAGETRAAVVTVKNYQAMTEIHHMISRRGFPHRTRELSRIRKFREKRRRRRI